LGITAEESAARGIDRAATFQEQIAAFLDDGVDAIFFETFTDLDEMEIALRAKSAVSDAPEICSFACAPDGRLRCGTRLDDAFATLRDSGAKIMGVNCMNDPREMMTLLQHIPVEFPLAVYPTAGNPRRESGRLAYTVTPKSFTAFVRNSVEKGARILGGCCGTTPAHIAALAESIRNFESR
jgi:homocysteine S-methyltransferase